MLSNRTIKASRQYTHENRNSQKVMKTRKILNHKAYLVIMELKHLDNSTQEFQKFQDNQRLTQTLNHITNQLTCNQNIQAIFSRKFENLKEQERLRKIVDHTTNQYHEIKISKHVVRDNFEIHKMLKKISTHRIIQAS